MRKKWLAAVISIFLLAGGSLAALPAWQPALVQAKDAVGSPNTDGSNFNYFDYMTLVADDPSTVVGNRFNNFGDIVNLLARILAIGAGTLFFFLILTAGYKLVFAGNKEEALRDVRKRLTIGIVGMVVVMAAYAITNTLLSLTGISW